MITYFYLLNILIFAKIIFFSTSVSNNKQIVFSCNLFSVLQKDCYKFYNNKSKIERCKIQEKTVQYLCYLLAKL